VSKTKILDKLSSYAFALGLVASKIQYIPINIATPFLNLTSLTLYLLGYFLWFLSSHFYPDHHPEYTEWYGFAQFKEQNIYAASLGILAALLSIAAIALPVLVIPAAWMFVCCNSIWTISEFHKLKNPLKAENYSESYQESYFSYALTMTMMGIIGALSTTLILLFPPITITILALSGIISVGLGIVAVEYWLDFTFGDHKKTQSMETSYNKMTNKFGTSLQFEETPSQAPHQGKDLFESSKDEKALETCFALPTCNTP
jgi:NhaP-type Na+/H+ or K+/H+ antiporter